MSPRRPRRRARRRSRARPYVLLVAAAILLALLVGGLAEVSRGSQGYDADSNRALAAQGSVVVAQSNATATQLRRFMAGIGTQTRQGLQIGLDAAVQQTADESARAVLAARSTPLGSVGADFTAVFADRAQSMSDLRAAVDGFLGMAPAPVPGTSGTHRSVPADSAALLSATQATNRIAAAGGLLSRSDDLYRSVRHTLAGAVGHARLPKSVWVTDPGTWGQGNVAAQVDLLSTSSTLAATHNLALRTVRLEPPALPTAPGASPALSVISPTSQLGVSAVLGNDGSVTEPRASVRFTLADQSSGAATSRTESVALPAGASAALPTVSFGVKPGTTYLLTVSVVLPAGQTVVPAALNQALEVAPAT
ncbi:MAG TPA: hypothetical protein VHS57_02250 [Acidimicrobiales bacterium]|nr:hypothetical protein [Acidimicrobiales bacterium]